MDLETYQLFHSARQCFQQGNYPDAISLCGQLLQKQADFPDAYNLLGIIAKTQGNFPEAKQYFQQGLSFNPHHIYLLNSLGALLIDEDLDAAEACLMQAVRLNKDFVNALYNLSSIKSKQGKYAEAVSLLHQVLQLTPENAEALANLSQIEEKQNNLEQAKIHAEKALSLNSHLFIPRLVLSYIEFRQENFQNAIDSLIPIFNSQVQLTVVNYSLAVGQIANAYDKLKQFSLAFEHYKMSNEALLSIYHSIYAESTGIYSPSYLQKQETLIRNFCIEKWLVEDEFNSDENYPAPVFLLGFPRSGTTLLEQMLSAHSRLTTLEEQETFIDIYSEHHLETFNLDQLANMSPQQIAHFREKYWERVSQHISIREGEVLIDKLPLNSAMLVYIYRLFPKAKIIFCVRDPRDVALSCYQQRFEMNTAMYQFLELGSTVNYYKTVMQLAKTTLEKFPFNCYFNHYQDIVDDHSIQLKKIIEFLELNWEDEVLNYRKKSNQNLINTPSNRQVVKKIYKTAINKWKNYQPFIHDELDALEKWVKYWGYTES